MGKIHDRFKAQRERRAAAMARINARAERMRVEFEPRPAQPGKGKQDELCNVTACQRPGAYYFNRAMRAWYCWSCAKAINRDRTPEMTEQLFGDLRRDPREGEEDPAEVARAAAERREATLVIDSLSMVAR